METLTELFKNLACLLDPEEQSFEKAILVIDKLRGALKEVECRIVLLE